MNSPWQSQAELVVLGQVTSPHSNPFSHPIVIFNREKAAEVYMQTPNLTVIPGRLMILLSPGAYAVASVRAAYRTSVVLMRIGLFYTSFSYARAIETRR